VIANPLYDSRPWWQVAGGSEPAPQLALEVDRTELPPAPSDQKRGLVRRGFCAGCGDETVELRGLGVVLDVREVEAAPGLIAFHGVESSWRLLGAELGLANWETVLSEHHCSGA
jgi:hypothetical protein